MAKGAFRLPLYASGGSTPDPAIYCPAYGYILDPDIYFPPIPIPETSVESITCICLASKGWRAEMHKFKLIKNGGDPYLYEIFDSAGTLVNSFTDTQTYLDFDFPTTIGYYTVKISLPSPSYFIGFYNNESSAVTVYDNCIEAIILNCPSMSQFSQRCNVNLKNVSWIGQTFNSLDGWGYMFQGCLSITTFVFPTITRTTISGIYGMFADSGIKKLDLTPLNVFTTLYISDGIVKNCKYLDELIMPSNFSGIRLYSLFQNTLRLRRLVMPDTWQHDGTFSTDVNASSMFNGSGIEGEVIINEIYGSPITSIISMFYNASNVEIIRFKGDWSNLANASSVVTGAISLRILEMPRIISSTALLGFTWPTSSFILQYYIGPDVGFAGLPANAGVIEITGEHDTSGFSSIPNVALSSNFRTTLTKFECIKLRVSRLQVGYTSNKFTLLTTLNIDWTNSPYTYATAPQIQISAPLDSIELNRIMNLLPTVAGGQVMDIGYCDGYTTCDRSIALSKGWTIRGWAFITGDSVSSVDRTTAVSGGNVYFDGGYSPSSKGCCWVLSPAIPTTSNTNTNEGVGDGAFVSNITGLTANKTYNLRAYVITTYGVVYGDLQTFTTLP